MLAPYVMQCCLFCTSVLSLEVTKFQMLAKLFVIVFTGTSVLQLIEYCQFSFQEVSMPMAIYQFLHYVEGTCICLCTSLHLSLTALFVAQ